MSLYGIVWGRVLVYTWIVQYWIIYLWIINETDNIYSYFVNRFIKCINIVSR